MGNVKDWEMFYNIIGFVFTGYEIKLQDTEKIKYFIPSTIYEIIINKYTNGDRIIDKLKKWTLSSNIKNIKKNEMNKMLYERPSGCQIS
jgi:hypothetical protein